ncbi:MAG: GGDEF domain-containing protein, partial [Terriglobales bacterium]
MQSDATRDSSPPVWNRESIIELFTRELARSGSSGANLTVIMARLDLQSTNRELAETQINFILIEIAKRWGASLRSYDHIGRYSSRQLLILVPGWEPSNAKPLAEKLRKAVAETPLDISGSRVRATMSFVPAASADFKSGDRNEAQNNVQNEVWRKIESALDRAEESGGNRVESLSDISKSAPPAYPRRLRIRLSWVFAGVLILGIAASVFFVPSWTCAPNLVGDILDSGELPPPLPANCALTTERPTETMMQSISKRPEV